jgi:WD40 repeat protein
MNRRRRPITSIGFLALVAACAVACATAPLASGPASRAPTTAPSPVASHAVPSPSAALPDVPAGRILFMREGPDGVEHYFTVNTDGTGEQALFEREGCGCAHWSHDGGLVYTLDATGHGTWSFTTVRPDGTGHRVLPNPIAALNLAPGASSSDGTLVAFWGWDDTDPSKNGLYASGPGLGDVHLVAAVPDGATSVEPFGVTPDGSKIIFFAETGRAEMITHGGDLYVVDADGSHLRKLNPEGTTVGFVGATPSPGSLSPDGRHVAFAAFETASGGRQGAVYVADMAGGEPRRLTEPTSGVYTVVWSPAGDWIAFTTLGQRSSVSVVRPDGTGERVVSPATDEVGYPSWSPDGKAFVVRRGADGANDLWIMDLEGQFIGQVTDEPSNYNWFSWAPHGP